MCPDLTAPENGNVTVTGYRTGDTAQYSCVGEYELVGDQTRMCMSNSQWSGQTPSCQLSPGNELHVYLLQVTKQLTCMKCAFRTCNCFIIGSTWIFRICPGSRWTYSLSRKLAYLDYRNVCRATCTSAVYNTTANVESRHLCNSYRKRRQGRYSC